MENKQYISTDFFTENGGFFNEKNAFLDFFALSPYSHVSTLCFRCYNSVYLRPKAKAHQSRQDHQQGDDFALDVLLVEAEDAVDE